MIKYKLKRIEEVLEFEYAVCEIKECEEKSEKLAMTETRFVDFCDKHYEEYLKGEM